MISKSQCSLILDICSWSLSKTSDVMGARLHTTHPQQEPCAAWQFITPEEVVY